MMDFIERLKAKPEHVRRRIAVGTSVAVTGVVTAAWFLTLLFSGTLSLAVPASGSSPVLAQENTATGAGNQSNLAAVNASAAVVPPQSNLSRLLAAVGISTAPPPAPVLKVEDAATTSSTQQASPTVIPF